MTYINGINTYGRMLGLPVTKVVGQSVKDLTYLIRMLIYIP